MNRLHAQKTELRVVTLMVQGGNEGVDSEPKVNKGRCAARPWCAKKWPDEST